MLRFGFLLPRSLGLWTFPVLPVINHGLLLPPRLSTIPYNFLTELLVFSNDLICSLIFFACFASSLLIFHIYFSILIMSYLMFHCALGVFLSMFLGIFQFRWVRYMQLEVDHNLASFPGESYFYVLLKEICNSSKRFFIYCISCCIELISLRKEVVRFSIICLRPSENVWFNFLLTLVNSSEIFTCSFSIVSLNSF